jgi:hypothetical protein
MSLGLLLVGVATRRPITVLPGVALAGAATWAASAAAYELFYGAVRCLQRAPTGPGRAAEEGPAGSAPGGNRERSQTPWTPDCCGSPEPVKAVVRELVPTREWRPAGPRPGRGRPRDRCGRLDAAGPRAPQLVGTGSVGCLEGEITSSLGGCRLWRLTTRPGGLGRGT